MTQDASRGRLFVVTGAAPDMRASVAAAMAARLDRSITVDCTVFDRMIVSGSEPEPVDQSSGQEPYLGRIRRLFLRWSAGLATAETYQLEGFDAVVTDELRGGRLEDFLDLAAPESVLLVVLDDGSDLETPRWGLWVRSPGRPAADLADVVLSRLDEALVVTAPA
jgi:hypothetical protein